MHPPMSFWFGNPEIRRSPTPPHLNPLFSGLGDGVGGKKMSKKDPPPFAVQNHESFGFEFEPEKGVFGSQIHGVSMGLSGFSDTAMHAFFGYFCYTGGFADVWWPSSTTLEGCKWGYCDDSCNCDIWMQRIFFQSLALPMAGNGTCERHELTVSHTNGLIFRLFLLYCRFWRPR